jgi:pilus assembly protein CpaE
MQALLATDLDHHANPKLQSSLSELGVDCPRLNQMGILEAMTLLRSNKTFELVVVVCPNDTAVAVRTISQMRALTAAPILVAGVKSQVNEILSLIRAGATDYLDLQGNMAADLTVILSRMRATHASKGGTLTCVLSSSGGCGASTLAVNLGASLGTVESPACLIDLNFRGGDLSTLLNARPRHTLVDLCCQGQRLDEEMFQQSLVHASPILKLLAAPPLLSRFSGIDLDAVTNVLEMARSAFRHLVVDLEDSFHPEQSLAIRSCDQLLILLRLDFPCLLRARLIVDGLREDGIDPSKIRLIANRIGNSKSLSPQQTVDALGMPVFHCLPDDVGVMLTSVNVGNPVVLEAPAAKISKAYRKLAELIAI